MATINSQASGGAAVGSDEFLINRAGTDYKLTHTSIVAGVTALIAAEEAARILADSNLNTNKLNISGGTMTGALTLNGAPTVSLHAATKAYVDAADSLLVPLAGGTMSGFLTLVNDPSSALHAATKQYVDTKDATKWTNPSALDCSSNPNYPVSTAGASYRVSVAGKIGGVSGKVVQVDDIIFCHTADGVGGTEASVGNKYLVLQTNLVQADQSTNGYSKIATDSLIVGGTDDETVITPRGARKIVNELVPNYNRISTASLSVTIPNTTQSTLYLLSGSASGAVAVNLPEISTLTGDNNITIVIKDSGLLAGTNNITINRGGSDLIDGATTKVISTNAGVVRLVASGTNWFTI